MPWKVKWAVAAEDSLAQIWIDSTDRNRVSEAAKMINTLLIYSPEKYLESLPEGLSFIDIPPLRAYLEVDVTQHEINVVGLGRPH